LAAALLEPAALPDVAIQTLPAAQDVGVMQGP